MATASAQLITPAPHIPQLPLSLPTAPARPRVEKNVQKTVPTQNQDLVRLEHEALAFFCGMGFFC